MQKRNRPTHRRMPLNARRTDTLPRRRARASFLVQTARCRGTMRGHALCIARSCGAVQGGVPRTLYVWHRGEHSLCTERVLCSSLCVASRWFSGAMQEPCTLFVYSVCAVCNHFMHRSCNRLLKGAGFPPSHPRRRLACRSRTLSCIESPAPKALVEGGPLFPRPLSRAAL